MNDPFNIVDLFFQAADKDPDKLAIVDLRSRITFGQLSQNVLDTAGYFQSKGIKKGDRVLIFVPMGMDLYRIVLALFKIGATAVFLDEWVSRRRLEACCQVAQCSAFVAIPKIRLLSFLSKELRKIPIKLGVKYKRLPSKAIETNRGDTALITFTTGSTGTPKAAKRTHGFLKEQFSALIDKINPQKNDVDMPALPIVLLINLGSGCTSVIPDYKASKPEQFQPEKVIEQWKKEGVNRFVSSPYLLKEISKYVIRNKMEVSTMEKMFTGGAPVFPNEAEMFLQAFPNVKIEIVYGSTEAEPISSISAEDLADEKSNVLIKGLNVGIPYSKTSVKIIGITNSPITCSSLADLEEKELANGKIGEIIVCGNHVLREYINNNAALLRNKINIGNTCWHRTGDSGYLQNGNLYLTGRCDGLIEKNGVYVSPFMYENFFQTQKGIEIGTILEIEEKIVAVLEKNSEFELEGGEGNFHHLDLALDSIIWLKKIPRDPRHNSKIDYQKLKQILIP
jgi:acyl-CoA synthetase (AMP-forming)/AMP-acid ligase II